ncbi:MAG: response regulator [Acidimicrobiia bacterium]|nr:response regulator [Acidimicrobiia bacterium]
MIPRQILNDDTVRVLLIAPDEADHAVISRLGAESRHATHDVDWVNSYEAGKAAIAAEDHDVYIVHNHLGLNRGLDLIVEAISGGSAAPYLVLTEAVDYELEIEALTAGATDHLVKERLTAHGFERAVRHALVHAQTRAELVAARDEAEAATRAKTKFLANVSHDIRTPLNAIIGMTEIVLRDDLTPTQRESMETVLVAGQSLLDLADRLANVDEIEAGEIDLHPAPFNIRDAVADVVRIFGLSAGQKSLDMNVNISTHFPEVVVADHARFQQVLIDLVSNAVKFTERGHIDIDVEAIVDDAGQPAVSVAVEDTGVGVPADIQSTIFERAAMATTNSGVTGLGVVQCIVAAMGGSVRMNSRVGKGTRITFTFAIEDADSGTTSAGADCESCGGVVLVMSSSPDDRRSLETDLEGGGFEPLIVGDIGAAADAAESAAQSGQPLAAIVLDTAYKPFEVAKTLIDLAGGATPVTLMAPSGREGDEPRCREAGVKGYVGKPAAPGILVDVIKATVAASRAGDTDTLFTADSLGSSRPTMNILVADDVETNLVLTVRMLTERGHSATAVRSGVEVVDAFEKSRFDAVLMDLQMPGVDGFDATAAIRAEEVLQGIPRTPIIALTGHTTAAERDRCVAAGMDGFLSKPVRPDALFAAVEQFAAAAAVA